MKCARKQCQPNLAKHRNTTPHAVRAAVETAATANHPAQGAKGAKAIAATTTRVIITALATATNATPARTIRTTAGRKLRKAQTDQTVPKTAPRRPKAESKRPLRGHSRVMSFRRSHSMIQRKSASFTLHLETASLEHGCRTLVSS